MSKSPSKAEQARNLTGRQTRDALEPLRSALLIVKWSHTAKSYDDPNVQRFYFCKSDYPTLADAQAALKDVGLPSGLDFTQYGRGNYDFGNLKEVIQEAALKLATSTPAPELHLVVTPAAETTTAGDSGSEEAPVATSKKAAPAASKKATKAPAAKVESDGLRWPEGVKLCPKCGEVKPRSEFASNRSAKDGAYHMDKACESAYNKARREAKAAEAAAAPAALAASKAPAKGKSKAPSASPVVVKHPRLPGQTFASSADLNVALDALDKAEAEAAAPVEVPAAPAPKRSRKGKGKAVVADGTEVSSQAEVAQAIADRLA